MYTKVLETKIFLIIAKFLIQWPNLKIDFLDKKCEKWPQWCWVIQSFLKLRKKAHVYPPVSLQFLQYISKQTSIFIWDNPKYRGMRCFNKHLDLFWKAKHCQKSSAKSVPVQEICLYSLDLWPFSSKVFNTSSSIFCPFIHKTMSFCLLWPQS